MEIPFHLRPLRREGLLRAIAPVVAIVAVTVIAVPKLNLSALPKARIYAQEMQAVREILMIQVSQEQHFSRFGRYPLTPLERIRNGYRYTLRGGPESYALNAAPVEFGRSGRRTFFTNQTGVIRQNWGPAPASARSEELK